MKCIKCGSYFYRKHDEEDLKVYKNLCFKCGFIWKSFGCFLESIGRVKNINRVVEVDLDQIIIRKPYKLKKPPIG